MRIEKRNEEINEDEDIDVNYHIEDDDEEIEAL
jgi:hypothetical protein